MDHWTDPRYAELVEQYRQTPQPAPERPANPYEVPTWRPVRMFLTDVPS